MFEEQLLNYGILGLWTAVLLFEKFRVHNQFKEALEKNTLALTRLCQWVDYMRKS